MMTERTFDSNPQGMLDAQAFLEGFCDHPKAAVIHDEIVSNIIRCSGTKTFSVKFVQEGGELTMVYIDSGKPFNPLTDAVDPDVTAAMDERGVGGLGIFMVKKMSKSVEYAREGDKNILTVKVAV